jgi:hypothetical protein
VKVLEDWKIKISVLWLVFEFGAVWSHTSELPLPGFIEDIMAGKLGGIQITPELFLILSILMLIPPIMAFLSLTLKNSANRWANIILGIVFAVIALIFPIQYIAQQSAYSAFMVLIGTVQFVAAALIVWYAWKSKQKT